MALGFSSFFYKFLSSLLDESLLESFESSLESSDPDDDAYFLLTTLAGFFTEDLSESSELEESSDDEADFFVGAFLFSIYFF